MIRHIVTLKLVFVEQNTLSEPRCATLPIDGALSSVEIRKVPRNCAARLPDFSEHVLLFVLTVLAWGFGAKRVGNPSWRIHCVPGGGRFLPMGVLPAGLSHPPPKMLFQ